MGIFDMLMGGGSFGGFGGGFGGSSHRAPSVFPHHDPLGDAVNEVVTETIKDVLNPERKERRRQTERCNDEAQEALDEANELRSHDIARLQAKTEDLGQQLQQQAETLAELKKRIGRSVEQEITPQIHRFQAFDIQQRVGCAPDMASASSSPALPSFGSMTSSVIGGTRFDGTLTISGYDELDGMTLHLERKNKRWQGNFNTAAGQPVTTVVHEIYGTKDFENLILDLWRSVEEADDGRMHYEFDLPAAHVLAFGVDTRMAALRRYLDYVDFAQN